MNLLVHLQLQGDGLRAMDVALADVLRRLDPDTDARVLAAAALASLAVGTGHAAFDPAQPQMLLANPDECPDAAAWTAALRASPWVSEPAAQEVAPTSQPLVLEDGLLYLRRYREYERRLAAGLKRIAAHAPAPIDVAALAPLFASLFPDARGDGGQARAAALALLRSLLLVVGGPGTGKTTTITRLLMLLVAAAAHSGAAPPRIALAAPTGRAAERMAESLRSATLRLRQLPGIDTQLFDVLPDAASTLHRLLGTVPGSPRFRHHAGQPLPFDVIVVDEASMVDLPLMCKLVEAVADGARLVLLGDRDQLPSVEAGDVLAAMTDAASAAGDDALPADAVHTLAPLLGIADGDPIASPRAHAPPLAGHCASLRRSYRQSDALELAPLAAATRAGDADAVLALLRTQALDGVRFHEELADPLADATREALMAPWRALVASARAEDPAAALAQAARVRLLTALREGPQGANVLNARIEEALAGTQREPYFHGRLLLVTENSYRHGLFNGDIGVCLREGDASVAWFAGGEGVRGFHPSALPAHSGAFAMTVHKAQGSEFDTVWLVLPKHDARPLSRELLYTAITRARTSLNLCAGEAVLRAALSRHAARISGLSQRLSAA
jgi:exodeoxyribonuclease V alpha subunit